MENEKQTTVMPGLVDPNNVPSHHVAKEIEITDEQIKAIGRAMIDFVNSIPQDQMDPHSVIGAMLWCMGTIMAQRGMVLELDAPLRLAVPPLAFGYENATVKMAERQASESPKQ